MKTEIVRADAIQPGDTVVSFPGLSSGAVGLPAPCVRSERAPLYNGENQWTVQAGTVTVTRYLSEWFRVERAVAEETQGPGVAIPGGME